MNWRLRKLYFSVWYQNHSNTSFTCCRSLDTCASGELLTGRGAGLCAGRQAGSGARCAADASADPHRCRAPVASAAPGIRPDTCAAGAAGRVGSVCRPPPRCCERQAAVCTPFPAAAQPASTVFQRSSWSTSRSPCAVRTVTPKLQIPCRAQGSLPVKELSKSSPRRLRNE